MIDKVDLVMWTKNGAETLSLVLKRISEVIPSGFVNKRVIVDDRSTDDTREIAKSFGWNVIFNEGKGISDGANTALNHVTSKYFISFEQDIVLADEWWENVTPLINAKNGVVVASGIRVADKPESLRRLQEYSFEKYRIESEKSPTFYYGKTLDNTIYVTEVLRRIGGFPKVADTGVDNVLAVTLHKYGYTWKVNFDVKNTHLRKGLLQELKHYYWYGKCERDLNKHLGAIDKSLVKSFSSTLVRTAFSPIRAVQVAWKQRCWQIVYVYPLIRISGLLGCIKGYW